MILSYLTTDRIVIVRNEISTVSLIIHIYFKLYYEEKKTRNDNAY